MARTVIAVLTIDEEIMQQRDDDAGDIDYLISEFGWLETSGIYLKEARILDNDDPEDSHAISCMNQIFD